MNDLRAASTEYRMRDSHMISPTAKPTSVRLGFMGHLTLIAEGVLTALERFPAELRGDRGQPAWDEHVAGWHRETNRRDAGLPSGGDPVVCAGGGLRPSASPRTTLAAL